MINAVRLSIAFIQKYRLFFCSFLLLTSATALAGVETFRMEIRDHLFYPSELQVPVGKKVKLIVKNTDKTPEEFESYELNREKVIGGGRKAVIFIGPLEAGEYPFFGEFHPKTAQGKIIAK